MVSILIADLYTLEDFFWLKCFLRYANMMFES